MDIIKDIEDRANEKLAALTKRRKQRSSIIDDVPSKAGSFVTGAVASSFAGDIRASVDAMKIKLYESIDSAAKPIVEHMLRRLRL